MTLSAEDIKGLIADFNTSDWDEMALTAGDVSVVISRSGGSQWAASSLSRSAGVAASTSLAADSETQTPARHAVAATAVTAPARVQGGSPEVVDADRPRASHGVTSPTVGLFWRSPRPGSPPFVEVGQRVEADETVCIIEVMKLMNHVKAGRAGTVVSIETENGAMVEHGTVLMLLEPDA